MGAENADTFINNLNSSSEHHPSGSLVGPYLKWTSDQMHYNASANTGIRSPAFFNPFVTSSPQGHPYMCKPQVVGASGVKPRIMFNEGELHSPPNGFKESSISFNARTTTGSNIRKLSGASTNGALPVSGESGIQGSAEGSEADSQSDSQQKQDEAQNIGIDAATLITLAASATTVAEPTLMHLGNLPSAITEPRTTLKLGMDCHRAPVTPISTISSKIFTAPSIATAVPTSDVDSHVGVQSGPSSQDEKEIKREKRKLSNRESARRSRLRKQAQSEEMAHRIKTLKQDNDTIRREMERLREECRRLISQNAYLVEELQKYCEMQPREDLLLGNSP